MNSQTPTSLHQRVNVTLPEDTLVLLDRVAEKGARSAFVDRAVRFYVQQVGYANIKKQLRNGAISRASRDVTLAKDWFSLD